VLGIVTKIDLMNDVDQDRVLNEVKTLPVSNWSKISSTTLEGVREVSKLMAVSAERYLDRKPGEVVLTQFEHVQAVSRALDCLLHAEAAFDLVLFATDVRHGMGELGPLIGETLPDDVLGKIFSDFCIGK
jgi:tRNA modification GTPase